MELKIAWVGFGETSYQYVNQSLILNMHCEKIEYNLLYRKIYSQFKVLTSIFRSIVLSLKVFFSV